MQAPQSSLGVEEFFVRYLDRVVPARLPLPPDFITNSKSWARCASADPASARNGIVNAWIAARRRINRWERSTSRRSSRTSLDEQVGLIFADLIKGRASKQETETFEPERQNEEQSRRFRQNLTDEERDFVRKVLNAFPIRTRFGDRLNPELIRDAAFTRVEERWDRAGTANATETFAGTQTATQTEHEDANRARLAAFARRTLRNLLIDAIRRMETEEQYVAPATADATELPDATQNTLNGLIGHGEFQDASDYIAMWTETTAMEFHKVLAFFWLTMEIAADWAYPEEQFAIPLRLCTEVVCSELSPAVRTPLWKMMSARPPAVGDHIPTLANIESYALCVWNDFSHGSRAEGSFAVSRQMNRWRDEARTSASNLLGRDIWNRQWYYLERTNSFGVIAKLCYCLTRGNKPKRSVADFVETYGRQSIEQLERDLTERLKTKRIEGSWITNQITREERSTRTRIRQLTPEQYFVPVNVSADPKQRIQRLEAEIEKRNRGLHKEIAREVLRDLKRKQASLPHSPEELNSEPTLY